MYNLLRRATFKQFSSFDWWPSDLYTVPPFLARDVI